ncbi:MAG: hypothetical protein GY869_19940 [Planctomycetes bacterium]|nr:hypothetical protein [Planctomycetota bacterium]
MNALTHRERVTMAFNHQEPDRIPLDLMGNASMLLDKTYLRLRDYLGLSPIPPIRSGSTANYYDERILEILDTDFRRIFLKKSPTNKITKHDRDSFTDIWGVRYKQIGPFVNAVGHPLQDVKTVRDVEAFDWPTATDLYTAAGLAEKAKDMYDNFDYALVARNPLSEGFLDRPCHMMGMTEFFISLRKKPDIAHCIIEHLLEIYMGVYSLFLDAVGPYVQMVEAADDLGHQEDLIISPKMYREFIKPAEKELYALIHEKAPRAKLFHHTDGAVFDILPDLIEVGVDVLNPVQTSARNMEAFNLKEKFGQSLIFHGSIEHLEDDVTANEVAAEVKKRIDAFAPGGGYVLSCCNHMIDVEPKNIVTMFGTAREFGRY